VTKRTTILLAALAGLLLATVGPAVLAAKNPVAIPGTEWELTGILKGKVQKGGKSKGPVTGDLYFGPHGGLGLAANEFELVLDDTQETMTLTGTYAVSAKGKVVLNADLGAYEDEMERLFDFAIETFFEQAFNAQVDDWWVTVPAIKMKFKAKQATPWPVCKLGFKAVFTFTADMSDGTTRVVKAAHTLKSFGEQD
jgi:hypothetical protein